VSDGAGERSLTSETIRPALGHNWWPNKKPRIPLNPILTIQNGGNFILINHKSITFEVLPSVSIARQDRRDSTVIHNAEGRTLKKKKKKKPHQTSRQHCERTVQSITPARYWLPQIEQGTFNWMLDWKCQFTLIKGIHAHVTNYPRHCCMYWNIRYDLSSILLEKGLSALWCGLIRNNLFSTSQFVEVIIIILQRKTVNPKIFAWLTFNFTFLWLAKVFIWRGRKIEITLGLA
jgi:hypothetical protein